MSESVCLQTAWDYARKALIPKPKARKPRVIRDMIDRAFRAGVKEGRRRERRSIEIGMSDPVFPRLSHGMFSE